MCSSCFEDYYTFIHKFLSHPTEISVGCALISRNPTVFILRFLCNNQSDGKSVGQLNDK